jgi:tetratricopeptide (TPR) repeat protein
MAERLLYLPSLGFCLAAAAGLHWLARRIQASPQGASRAFVALSALFVALHGARAIDRSLDWRSENGLYVHDLEVSPRSVKIQSNAGAALAEMERHDEALRCYAAAIAITPDFAAPYRGSVLSLLALGRFEQAQAMYQETLRFGPPVPVVEEAIRLGLSGP